MQALISNCSISLVSNPQTGLCKGGVEVLRGDVALPCVPDLRSKKRKERTSEIETEFNECPSY